MSQNPSTKFPFDRVRPFLPWLIFVFAFSIRLAGIGWGLPNGLHNQSYHPDEQVIFSYSQAIDPAHLQFTPGFYNYGTLYLTALNIAGKMVSTYGGAPKPNDMASMWVFAGAVDLAGRLLTALAGAGTAVVLFLMLRRFTRTLGALAAGFFIAIAPAFVVHSRFQTVDVPAAFFLALSLYYATKILPAVGPFEDREDWSSRIVRFGLLAGIFAGLSAGTKYTGILALIGLFVACFLSESPQRWKAAAVGVVASLLAFVVSTPGVLWDNAKFMHDFRYEMLHTSTGHDLLFVDVGSGFIYHLKNLVVGITPFLLILAVCGLVGLLVKRQRWIWVLLAFSLVYFVLIGRAEVLFLRYTFPLYIVLAAGFGWLMGEAHSRQGKYKAIVALGILALGFAALETGRWTSYMVSQDPRDTAVAVLRDVAKTSPNMTVGIVSDPWYYTPPLIPDSAIFRGPGPEKLQVQEMAVSHDPKLEQYLPPNIEDRFDWDKRLLSDVRPDYIVYSSFEDYDLSRLQNAKGLDAINQLKVDRYKEFNQELVKGYERYDILGALEAVHIGENDSTPYLLIPDLEYIQPWIVVWKRKDLH